MKKIIALGIALVVNAGAAHGQSSPEMIPAATPEAVVAMAMPAEADAKASTDDYYSWVESFEQQFQSIGVISDGRTFFSGKAEVRVTPIDPNYGRELALAYEKAMFDMRAEFVMSSYGRMVSDLVRDIYEDSSSNKDEFDPVELKDAQAQGGGKLDRLLDKAISLVDKKLDNALIEQGVPADQVQRQTIEQKKTTYKNNLRKEMIKKAFHSMQGLVPVQTRIFSEKNVNGTAFVVGVIAVQSDKTRQFALDMSRKRPTMVRGEPKKMADLLPGELPNYLNEIGLRFSYDEKGFPMLISYGRYALSVKPDWKPGRVNRSTQNATSMAQTLAESSIIEFMNTNVQLSELALTGSQEEDLVTKITEFENEKKSGESLRESSIGETISQVIRQGSARSQGDLRGSKVVKRWQLPDDQNKRVINVGAVVTWTYAALDNANAIDAQGSNVSGALQKPAGTGNQPTRASKMVNKLSDF